MEINYKNIYNKDVTVTLFDVDDKVYLLKNNTVFEGYIDGVTFKQEKNKKGDVVTHILYIIGSDTYNSTFVFKSPGEIYNKLSNNIQSLN